jgi:hypothetical protein
MSLAAKLLHPSTIVLIAANLLPLAGIWFWNWDAFLLLALYWMETAVAGFWTVLAIAARPFVVSNESRGTSPFVMVPFFIVHSGIFMTVHFMFLWSLFSGTWSAQIHSAREFFDHIVIGQALWIPLAAFFVSRGVSVLFLMFGRRLLPGWAFLNSGATPADDPLTEGNLLGGFYGRIVIMHLTVLFGAAIAGAIGSIGPLVLMVALKIAADLGFHLRDDFPAKPVMITTAQSP